MLFKRRSPSSVAVLKSKSSKNDILETGKGRCENVVVWAAGYIFFIVRSGFVRPCGVTTMKKALDGVFDD